MSKGFTVLISVMAVIFIGLACLFGFKSCVNSAISKENIVLEQKSDIANNQAEMISSLKLLAQNVEKGSSVEVAFQENIAEKRGQGLVATDEGIQNVIAAVREAYPDYKSNELFEEMNTAIQKYNSSIKHRRSAYQKAVREYNTFTSKWPNNSVITMQGYEIKKFENLADDNYSAQIEKPADIDSLY